MDIPSGRTLEVPGIPVSDRLELGAERTAVVVVDMQNDFVREDGALHVPDAAGTVGPIAALVGRARSSGARIAYTQDTHFEGDREWEIWPRHCRRGTGGWEIISELKPRHDLVCEKHRYDGFYGTELGHYLHSVWRVENVVVVGTVANICVLHTAGSAGLRWMRVVTPADCISAQTPFDHALALRQVTFLYAGTVLRRGADIAFS